MTTTVEVPQNEKIEAARARLQTAWLQHQVAPNQEGPKLKWEERKRELAALLTNPNAHI